MLAVEFRNDFHLRCAVVDTEIERQQRSASVTHGSRGDSVTRQHSFGDGVKVSCRERRQGGCVRCSLGA